LNTVGNKLIENKRNAWCMPGGKNCRLFWYFANTLNDSGLATVMGHEVSHALANHGAQRMKCLSIANLLALGVAVATSGKVKKHNLGQAYGLVLSLVMLPLVEIMKPKPIK
jgi:Zn-dependent protease with chaperone function